MICVILNHNGHYVLKKAIESVMNQSRPADKVVVLDNKSVDESWRIARMVGIDVVHADNQYQFISGLNDSFSLFDGQIFFMSNDMVLDREFIQRIYNTPYDITWPSSFDEKGVEYEPRKKAIMTGAFMMHSDVFKTIGEFDTNLAPAYYEDLDYSIRAKKLGFTMGKCKEARLTHQASHSFSKVYKKKEIGALCRRNLWYLIKKHGLIRVIQFLYT